MPSPDKYPTVFRGEELSSLEEALAVMAGYTTTGIARAVFRGKELSSLEEALAVMAGYTTTGSTCCVQG